MIDALARFIIGLVAVVLFILGPLVAGAVLLALLGIDCAKVAC